jgi:hypothetical protein
MSVLSPARPLALRQAQGERLWGRPADCLPAHPEPVEGSGSCPWFDTLTASDVYNDFGLAAPVELYPYLVVSSIGNFVKGNRLAFAGIADKTEREDLVAYLERATKPD